MSTLVTGGAGYIGSHCVKALIERGQDVTIIDNLSTGNRGALQDVPFYEGDLKNAEFLEHVFKKERIDAVIHFAASSLVGESMQEPGKYLGGNVAGSVALFEAMRKYNVRDIVFSSTAATFGEPMSDKIDETHPQNPTNPYGESKLMIERILNWYYKIYGLRYVCLRYFNVAGADKSGLIGEAHQPETHLIPLVLQTALGKRGHITVFGTDYNTPDGTCVRDYIHVSDLIDAHFKALTYLQKDGEPAAFNLGNGNGFSVREILDAAGKVTGKKIAAEYGSRRAGDPATLVASSEAAKKILGWEPEFTVIGDIIDSAWNWHRNNPDGYR